MKFSSVVSEILKQKITPVMYFSAGFFLVCMSLDFYITNLMSQGNSFLEGNFLARWWWQISGLFRFIEIPIYAVVMLGAAYIINYKSKFFPLFWLNLLALNHLMGFLSWLPYGILDFIYTGVKYEWAVGYVFSLISVLISLPLTLLQLRIGKLTKKIL